MIAFRAAARAFARRPLLIALGMTLTACGPERRDAEVAARENERIHRGCCDASAGVALGEGLFAVANDEDSVIRIYDRHRDGPPVREFDLADFLQVDPDKPETDLEGAARLGGRVFWISSHGRNKSGKERLSRQRFFATTFGHDGAGPTCEASGVAYEGLLEDLVAEPRLSGFDLAAASRLAPKQPGALNIEGLCGTAEGHLWIGFRNPVPDGLALIVPLLNPGEIVDQPGTRARFGDPLRLDLGGLGIRSLAWDGERFLIAAGPIDDEAESALYRWDGGDGPPERVVGIDFRGSNPEGLLVLPDAEDGLLVLSDDGTVEIDGVACKDLPDPLARRFRSFIVRP